MNNSDFSSIDIAELKRKYRKRSQAMEVWMRLRKNRTAMLGLAILIVLILLSIFADVIVDYNTMAIKQNIAGRLQPPSADHWFGTDEYGRDIFARIIHGTRISLYAGLITVGIGLVLGAFLGAVAGYYGGRLDNVIMRMLDVLLAIPNILFAMAVVAALGSSNINLLLALGIANVPKFARVVRASVISLKDQEFIEASRAIGAGEGSIIINHILPNCLAPIIVQSTLRVAVAVISISGLSFLGMGIQPPVPEWGSMLTAGRSYIRNAPHLALLPGLAIILTVLALNLLGDGLRDALDPRLK